MYVRYNSYGGIDEQISNEQMEQWLTEFEANPTRPILGVWEFTRMPNWNPTSIYVRISPSGRLDGIDHNWRDAYEYILVDDGK